MSLLRNLTPKELKRNFKLFLQRALDTGDFVPSESGLDNQTREAIDAVAKAYPRTKPDLVIKAQAEFNLQLKGEHEKARWA